MDKIKEIKIENTHFEQTYWERLEIIRLKINEIIKFCNEK